MAHRGRSTADSALLAALSRGLNVRTAAAQAGIAERTAYRRLRTPEFREALSTARREAIDAAAGALSNASGTAATALIGLLRESTPPSVRLAAARAVLELGGKLREETDVEARLAALEAAVAEREGRS